MIHPIEKVIDAFLKERKTDATLIVSEEFVYAIVRVPTDNHGTPQAMLDIMQVLAETMLDGAEKNEDPITEMMASAVMESLVKVVDEEHKRFAN